MPRRSKPPRHKPDLAEVCAANPTVRTFLARVAEFGVINLYELYFAAGRPLGRGPRLWLREPEASKLAALWHVRDDGGLALWATGEAGWSYLRFLSDELREADNRMAIETAMAAYRDPIGHALATPGPHSARFATAIVGIMDEVDAGEAGRRVVAGAVDRTRELSEHERETQIARVQRAVKEAESARAKKEATDRADES